MWPWEHLALGYLCYSLGGRAVGWQPPTHQSAAVLAFATQFPDLVDKPLGWMLGVVPDGTAFAHSLLFAVPFAVLVGSVCRAAGRSDLGLAFAVGSLSHLPADALYPVALGAEPKVAFLLWPLVGSAGGSSTVAVLPYVRELFVAYLAVLSTPAGVGYLLLETALLAGAVGVWVLDGRPGWVFGRRPRPIRG